MDRRNRAALGFLLAGIATSGRAFLSVPETSGMAELSLTVLMLVGYLVLTKDALPALLCGVCMAALELLMCGSEAGTEGLWMAVRLADLWLMAAAVWFMTKAAGKKAGPEVFGKKGSGQYAPVLTAALLAVYTVILLVGQGSAASAVFVAYSISLLWYAVIMLRAYSKLQVTGDRRRRL